MAMQCSSPAAHAATLRKAQEVESGINCPFCNVLVTPDSSEDVEQAIPRLVVDEERLDREDEDGDGNKSSISPIPFPLPLDRFEGIQPGDLEFVEDGDGLEILDEMPDVSERQAS